jgi:hypothetical protein
MAEFLDEPREDEELQLKDDEELQTFDDPQKETIIEENQAEEPDAEAGVEDEEDTLPEKYKGKSAKDIIQMHQEAEKLLGRQSSEVGDLRRLVDNFILNQTQAAKPTEEKKEDIDFFEDPEKAMNAAIEKHPKIKAAEQLQLSLRQKQAVNTLESKHPDFQDILQEGDFGEWVKGSKVRTELFKRAHQGYDYDAADELFSNWKERKRIIQQTKEVEGNETKRQRKAAATGSSKGSGEGRSRKIYRRADIIDLMRHDPNRYAELADEITLAYAEKRVK